MALAKGTLLLTISFSNHPTEILSPGTTHHPIYPLELKCGFLAHQGIDVLLLIPFTEELARESAAQFLETVYSHQPFSDIVLGHDATFGSDQKNNRQHVLQAANRYHADVHYLSALSIEGQVISSRRIRAFLEEGNLSAAEKFLGRPFT